MVVAVVRIGPELAQLHPDDQIKAKPNTFTTTPGILATCFLPLLRVSPIALSWPARFSKIDLVHGQKIRKGLARTWLSLQGCRPRCAIGSRCISH